MMFLVSILLHQCCYLECWFYLILLILWWKVLMVPLNIPLMYRKYILYVYFSYFREHVINVHGSHIRHHIIIIRTGVVVRDVITYHEINSLVIIWNTAWNNVWKTVIVVCDSVSIDCIDMVNRKVIDIFWCIVLWYVWSIFLDILLYIRCSG